MTWCPHCAKNSDTHRDHTTGSVCCVDCGKVVSQDLYTEDATFVKDASGATRLSGNMVRMGTACSESHKRTLEKGDVVIDAFIQKYGMTDVNHATKYYEIAVERGFTRGRRTAQVAAACLYVACRELEKPFLLIEFSSELGVSVYELGTVYLQLCKLLSLQDHPFVQKPVDPSLFIHRYIRGLMGECSVLTYFTHPCLFSSLYIQARILAVNASYFLKSGGYFVISIKANCIDSTVPAKVVFASEVKKLQAEQFKPMEHVTLEPFERDHACVVGAYRVPKKQKSAS